MRRCLSRVVVRSGADRVQRGRQTTAEIVDPGCEPFCAAILKDPNPWQLYYCQYKIVLNNVLVCCRVDAPSSWVLAKPGAICSWKLSNIFSLGWLCGGSEKEEPLLAGRFQGEETYEPCYVSPDRFVSMEAAYQAGQAKLAEFQKPMRSEYPRNNRWRLRPTGQDVHATQAMA